MHPDETALLAAVCAAPDDDLPRLVYADWCDEQGRHIRADFIRSQVELARLEKWFQGFTTRDERKANGPDFGRRLSFLRKRVKALLEDQREEATGITPDFPFRERRQFARGFLSFVVVTADQVCQLPDWLSRMPVPSGRVLTDIGQHLTPDADHPLRDPTGWDLITDLQLHDRYWHPWQLPDLAPEHLALLADIPLTRLAWLDLDNCRLTDDHAVILAERLELPALRSVDLRGNRLTPAGVRALSEAPWWAGLHELSLSCSPPVRELVEVLTAARITGLRSLTIGNNHELSGRVGEQLYGDLVAAYPNTVIEIT